MINKGDLLIKNLIGNKIEQEIKSGNLKKLKKACNDFEAFFLNMVFSEMRKGLPGNALFPESNAKKIYEYMYYDALTRQAVKERSLGIATMLFEHLKQFVPHNNK